VANINLEVIRLIIERERLRLKGKPAMELELSAENSLQLRERGSRITHPSMRRMGYDSTTDREWGNTYDSVSES
jgi:hypothetical protein